jgi:hypothetical protein
MPQAQMDQVSLFFEKEMALQQSTDVQKADVHFM